MTTPVPTPARLAALALLQLALLAGGPVAAATIELVDGWGGGRLSATDTAPYSPVAVAAARDGWTSQRWVEEPVSGDVHRYRNPWSGHYLTAKLDRGGSPVETAPLVEAWASQRWRREDAGGGQVRLRNEWTGRYLNATGDADWSPVDASDLVASWGSQRWRVRTLSADDAANDPTNDSANGGAGDDGAAGSGGSGGGGVQAGGDPGARGVGADIAPTGTVRTLQPGEDVQAAIDSAPAGSTVQLGAGTWTGVDVQVTKSITIDGVPGTVLDGAGAPRAFGIWDGADGATVQDLTIRNYRDGIQVAGADRVSLRNLALRDIGAYSGDSFSNVDTAIQVDGSTGSRVANCDVRGAAQKGIGVGVSTDVDVVDNVIRSINAADAYDPNWNVGAIKYFASSGTIANNEASDVHGNAIWIDTSRYVRVLGNRAYGNEDAGIYVEKTPVARVENNDADLIIATRWSLENGASFSGNDVATTEEPDYWNCGAFDCGADERNRALGVDTGRAWP